MAFLADQSRPAEERRGTGAPLEYVIVQMAEKWHMHPADVDPRGQRPKRARWFWWALKMAELEAKVLKRGG